MPKFFVPCTWEVTGFHIISARNLATAQEIASDPEAWVGENAHLYELPKPEQEITNNEFAFSFDDTREATPEEIKTAEAPGAREALRSSLTSLELLEGFAAGFEDDEAQENVRWMLETARASITTARAALGLEVIE